MKLMITLIAVFLVLVVAMSCLAGDNPSVKMAVHIKAHSAKMNCGTLPAISAREELAREWDSGSGESVDAIVYLWGFTEFLGVEFAMLWPPEWGSASFTPCGDLVIGGISAPSDSGISMTWLACQNTPGFQGVGWAWIYATSAGDIGIRGHTQHDEVKVLDCAEGIDIPDTVYWGAVDQDPIEGPPAATLPTTWGKVKSLFN